MATALARSVRRAASTSAAIGGFSPEERNLVSATGSGLRVGGRGTRSNFVIGNYVGTDVSGVAHNAGRGVAVIGHAGNSIAGNSIYANGAGIQLVAGGNNELTAPVVSSVSIVSVSGHACSGCNVEIFSDSEAEGRLFEGSTLANGAGVFTFTKASGYLTGPNVTATATDSAGNTSAFSEPATVPPKPPRRRAVRH